MEAGLDLEEPDMDSGTEVEGWAVALVAASCRACSSRPYRNGDTFRVAVTSFWLADVYLPVQLLNETIEAGLQLRNGRR